MDPSLIPPGNYCYRIVDLKPGEALSQDIELFGRELREFPYAKGKKEVLCPYWQLTEYGMVRCRYLEVETLDEDDPEARSKALAHFGEEQALDEANQSSLLYDEIKVCGVNGEWVPGMRERPARLAVG